jgi:hypothetical protein
VNVSYSQLDFTFSSYTWYTLFEALVSSRVVEDAQL